MAKKWNPRWVHWDRKAMAMKKLFFEIERDGFYGTYYENPKGADCAMIGLFGDDPNDYMAKGWL